VPVSAVHELLTPADPQATTSYVPARAAAGTRLNRSRVRNTARFIARRIPEIGPK
jgi:hypothetical protein